MVCASLCHSSAIYLIMKLTGEMACLSYQVMTGNFGCLVKNILTITLYIYMHLINDLELNKLDILLNVY